MKFLWPTHQKRSIQADKHFHLIFYFVGNFFPSDILHRISKLNIFYIDPYMYIYIYVHCICTELISHRVSLYIYTISTGLDKLRARWRACTQRARKKVFTCTKLRARKSIKTFLSSTPMSFKLLSYFCVWKQIIFGTIKSDIHNLFQVRSCCYIVIFNAM